MNTLRYLLLGAGLLTGCHGTPEKTTGPATSPATAAPATTNAAAARPATRPFVGYHRYRGTVGGQPVTVELTISSAGDSLVCVGSYAYDRHSDSELQLRAPHPYRASQLLALTETTGDSPQQLTGRWQAGQVAGPLLSGTWRSPGGRQLPFELHEDYTDEQGHLAAVRYELVGEEADIPCEPDPREGETATEAKARAAQAPSDWSAEYLHLLGPDTLRPALRALQCPVPAQRRRLVQQAVQESNCEEQTASLVVDFNGYGLLATTASSESYSQGAAHPLHGIDLEVYDLQTGHTLTRQEVLRPGTETALSRLLTRHLAEDEQITAEDLLQTSETDSTLVPLPSADSFGMVREGLVFQYHEYEITPYVMGPPSVIIPWYELQPLLRLTSPVARMLRARGLWHPVKTR